VAELAGDGWPARGAGRLFFDDTLVLVAIVMFCHFRMGWHVRARRCIRWSLARVFSLLPSTGQVPRPVTFLGGEVTPALALCRSPDSESALPPVCGGLGTDPDAQAVEFAARLGSFRRLRVPLDQRTQLFSARLALLCL
jgi:hypothetical protein